MIPAICINDSNKPNEVDVNEWVVKGNKYTIKHIYYHPNQGIQGVELKEIRLTDKSKPYETYSLHRFGIPIDKLKDLIELIKNCTELNDVDINKLIEESQLELIEV